MECFTLSRLICITKKWARILEILALNLVNAHDSDKQACRCPKSERDFFLDKSVPVDGFGYFFAWDLCCYAIHSLRTLILGRWHFVPFFLRLSGSLHVAKRWHTSHPASIFKSSARSHAVVTCLAVKYLLAEHIDRVEHLGVRYLKYISNGEMCRKIRPTAVPNWAAV